jgi:uncharacterized membrane protein
MPRRQCRIRAGGRALGCARRYPDGLKGHASRWAGATMADATNRSNENDRGSERRRRRTVANLAFGAIKAQHAKHRSSLERFVDRLNQYASSTPFLVAHAIWFGVWIAWNTGLLGLRPFDPFPFGLLTMVVSLEAIFLSIFVLMAQQRESAIAELREELGLQVSLRVEQEVTKTLQLVAGLYTRMGHRVSDDPELHHMLQPLDVRGIEKDLLEQIEAATEARHHNPILDDTRA